MNRVKTFREFIILGAIAALLLVYIIFRTAGNINYDLPVLTPLDTAGIDRITVTGPDTNLEFSRTDESWMLVPEGWAADKAAVRAISSAAADLKPTDLISSSGSVSRYDLDEKTRITVKAYGGDSILREFYVGKISSSGIYTYIMLPGDRNIYSVRGDLPSEFSGDKDSLRDKEILSVPREGAMEMTLSTGNSSVTIAKDGTGLWQGRDGAEIDSDSAAGLLPVLSPLRCTGFLESLPSAAARWRLDIQSAEDSIFLEIWPKTADGYPARSSANGFPVLLTAYTTEKILGVFGVETAE